MASVYHRPVLRQPRKPMPQHPMRTLLLALSIAAVSAGCGIVYRQPIYQGNLLESTAVEQLQEGMSKQQVLGLIGTPSIQDPFHHDRWDYTRSEEHTSELQSLMSISSAVFCLKKKKKT